MGIVYDQMGNVTSTDGSVEGTKSTSELESASPIDRTKGSYNTFCKAGDNVGVLEASKTQVQDLLSKAKGDNNFSANPKINKEKDPTDTKASAPKKAKDTKTQKNPSQQKPENPTAAAADAGKTILDAIKSVDPGNIGDIVKKSLDAMIMLKMISSVTSPAGIANMVSGALGSALQNIAGQVGLGPILGQLNSIMPQLSTMLSPAMTNSLNHAMTSMISGEGVGALSLSSVASAASLASSVAAGGSPTAVASLAGTIGGAALGVDPNTLASKILTMSQGQTYTYVEVINGINVQHKVEILNTNFQTTLNTIPSLSGDEHVNIASSVASSATSQLQSMMQTGMSAAGFASFLNGVSSDIANQGMKAILGTDLNGILGNVSKILPNIAGNITGALSSHVPKTALDPSKIQNTMKQASKVLALGRTAFNIAKMFSANPAEMIGNLAGALGPAVAALAQGASLSTHSPDGSAKITSTNQGPAPDSNLTSTNSTTPATTSVA